MVLQALVNSVGLLAYIVSTFLLLFYTDLFGLLYLGFLFIPLTAILPLVDQIRGKRHLRNENASENDGEASTKSTHKEEKNNAKTGQKGGFIKGALHCFGLDIESLCALRIALGIGILGDLTFRSQVLQDFYTDDGILPRDMYLQICRNFRICDYEYPSTTSQNSMHLSGGSYTVQVLIWTLHAFVAVNLIIGNRTQLFSILAYVLTESLHMRNHFMNDKGAMTLRVFLFWGMFLPLGSFGSLDSVLTKKVKRREGSVRVLTAATIAYFAQVSFIYWFSFCYKWRVADSSWRDGTAVNYALSMVNYKKPLGALLNEYPILVYLATIGADMVESIGPLFLYIPFPSQYTWIGDTIRGLVAIGFIGFHLSLALTIDLGIFGYISCIPFVAFVPGQWYRFLARYFGEGVYIPQLCSFIEGIIGEPIFTSNNSSGAVSSNVDGNTKHSIDKKLQGKADLVEKPLSNRPGNKDKNLQESNNCRFKRAGHDARFYMKYVVHLLKYLISVACICYIYLWNYGHYDRSMQLSPSVQEVGALIGLRQHWKLFTDLKNGYDDCRVLIGGKLGGNNDATISFMEWRKQRNSITREGAKLASSDLMIRNESTGLSSGALHQLIRPINNTLYMTSDFPAFDYAHYIWKTFLLAVRFIDPIVERLGDFMCAEWNSEKQTLGFFVDGKHKSLEYSFGDSDEDVVENVEKACKDYSVTQEECQKLADFVVQDSVKMKMSDWYVLTICKDRIKSGYTRSCEASDDQPFTRFSQDVPGLV